MISIIIFLLVMYSNQKWAVGSRINAQDDIGPEDLLILNDAGISTDFFSTCLEVTYTRYGGVPEAADLGSSVLLMLSLDNISWIEVSNYTFDDTVLNDNVSMTFKICNTLIQPFPFDVEKGETLYVCVACEYRLTTLLGNPIYQTPSLAIVVSVDITRPWYFTIDWTLPGVFGMIFLFLFAVFCISKRDRSKMDPML